MSLVLSLNPLRSGSKRLRSAARLALVVFLPVWMSSVSNAEETTIRVAKLASVDGIPVEYALEKGFYKEAGLDVEVTEMQSGPAIVSAIVSGAVNMGISAPVPPINARGKGLPIQILGTLSQEVDPDTKSMWLVASKASGIISIQDVRGKKIAINANGSLCELAWRNHLETAGIKWSELETVVLPFPQQEAALEQGGVDATCTIMPMRQSIMANAQIAPVEIGNGLFAVEKDPVIMNTIFTTADFVSANKDKLRAFMQATTKAYRILKNDPAERTAVIVKFAGVKEEAAAKMELNTVKDDISVSAPELAVIIDSLRKAGVLESPITADDMLVQLQ